MIGPDAEHLAPPARVGDAARSDVADMLELPFYHPVVEEGLRTALRDAYGKLDLSKSERRAA